MGNCCGSQSSDSFQGEGRTLGATPANAPPHTNNARAAAPPKISAPKGGKTLGKNPQAPEDSSGPREAAARAAEERAKAAGAGNKPKGNLQRQLDAQKSQTQSDTLAAAARENLDTRNVDAADKQRNWD